MIVGTATVPPFFKNGFVVTCETTREGVIIDPGDEIDELIAAVRLAGTRVTGILLTHAHLDHITGVARALAAFPTRVWLHRDDLFLYDGVVEQGRFFGMALDPAPPVDSFYDTRVPLRFGRHVVDVHHTPGHSPGGVCLAIGPDGTADRELFVGDTLFAGAIGRVDLPGGHYETLIRSIRTVLFSFPDETIVRPGHGPNTTIGNERRTNPFLTATP